MMHCFPNHRGVSLIAAVFIIVILGFMGVMFVSLINTGSLSSVNDLQSTQALYVAEGGIEYILENRAFPNYSMGAATTNLGAGRFTVSSPTYLTADPGAAGITINVQSTANFPNAGSIIIDSELITYTGKNATQFNLGVTRGVGGTTAVAHPTANASVYPVTTVTDNPLPPGNMIINVTSNVGFSIPGVIIIDMEYIFCSSVNGTVQLTNCTRGYNNSPATAHPNLSNVFQYTLTSTGTVGNAQRVVERSARQIPGAMMVYARAAGDPVPYYRRWDGTSWGPEFQATPVGAAGRTIQYMVLKFARTRNEAVLGTLDSTGDIVVQVWDGATWGGTLLLTNIGTTNDAYRGFDIEYETNGDRALVVYNNNNVANQVSYCIWSGLAWSAPANQNLATASIGIPYWIELAPNPLNASNEIAMIVLGSLTDVYGLRWTGAAWNNMGVAGTWDTAAANNATKIIDVAYEQTTGRAMFIWGNDNADNTDGDGANPNEQRYSIWNGILLGAPNTLTIASMGGVANWVRLVPDPSPASNQLMYGVQDSGRDLNTRLWNGAAWDTAVQHPEHDGTTEIAGDRNFDIVFETAPANAGRAWLLWGDQATVSRKQWNSATASWGAAATVGDDTSLVQLLAHPISGAVFACIHENANSATDDIWESHLTSGGATWSAKFTSWGGPVTAGRVWEKCALAAERINPLIVQGWREIFP